MPSDIVIYSAQLCGDCQTLKAFMDENGVAYEVRDIKEDPAHGEELEAKTGKLGVPYLIIDGEWKRGYEIGKPFSEAFARDLLGISA
jgi:glutaredoxin